MGALSQNLFTMIVAMAVITTMAMPPTLRWALSRIPLRKEEKTRLEREAQEAKGFVSNLERLLLAVDDSSNGKFASRFAGMLAGTHGMPTTVLHINEDAKALDKEAIETEQKKRKGKTSAAASSSETKKAAKISAAADPEAEDKKAERDKEAEAVKVENPPPEVAKKAEEVTAAVKQAAQDIQSTQKDDEKHDGPVEVTTIVHELPSAAAVAAEAKKGYDLLIVGLKHTSAEGSAEFHEDVSQIAQGFDGPVAITAIRGELDRMPNHNLSILVPVNGTEQAKRGAEAAIVMARATNSQLTVLYVAPREAGGKSARQKASRGNQEAILKEIAQMAGGYNLDIHTAMLADAAANDAILKEAERRNHNLIVLGVGRRPGESLFFGDTAAGLLADAKCSLLFLAT
jgi:nucleotide-binding universal stress UspA family protein